MSEDLRKEYGSFLDHAYMAELYLRFKRPSQSAPQEEQIIGSYTAHYRSQSLASSPQDNSDPAITSRGTIDAKVCDEQTIEMMKSW